MLFGGIALLVRSASAWAIRILFPYLIIWMCLKIPALIVAPGMEAVWLGFGELAVLMTGGWVLFANMSQLSDKSPLHFLTTAKSIRAAQLFFAVWLIPIGLSHIFYVKATVDLVPAWLPTARGGPI